MTIDQNYHKKTILQVLPALNAGGVELVTLEIAKKIIDTGSQSIVISAGGSLVESLTRQGSLHIRMDVDSKNPFKIFYNSLKISKIIKKYKVDVLHVHSRAPAWSCYMSAKSTGVYFVTSFHGVYNFKNNIKKWYNSVMTKGDHVIAVSDFVQKHIFDNYNVDRSKVSVAHCGVNCDDFSKEKVSDQILSSFKVKYNVPDDVTVLLLPSRITRWKGHLVLIDALAKIKHLNFYCIIAGDYTKHPAYLASVRKKINESGLEKKVNIFKNEPNIVGLYAIADIVLSTSIEPEAFGRTIIEAQSMEKIVVATNIGGASETIENNVTGFHVDPSDSNELSKKINETITMINSKEYELIKKQARKEVKKKFSLDAMLSNIMNIYKLSISK